MSDTLTLHQKLAQVRRYVGKVEKKSSDDDEFDYVPAAPVFEKVRAQLHRLKVLVIPKVTESDFEFSPAGRRHASVRLLIRFVDLENPGDMLEVPWAGEGADKEDKALAKACTAALKSFYLDFFLIRTVEAPESTDRHRARRQRANRDPKVTASQINNLIHPALKKHNVGNAALASLLSSVGVETLEQLPREKAGEFVKKIEDTFGGGSK